MKIRAYGYNLNKDEYELVRKMIKVVTETPGDIIDLRSYEIKIGPTDVLFLFGPKAILAGAKHNGQKLEFPDISRLMPGSGDPEERQEAFKRLVQFKETIKKNVQQSPIQNVHKLTKDTLPAELTAEKIQTLEAILRSKGSEEWIGKTLDGKTIRITVNPETSSADINLTFSELYAVRIAMETFKLKEFEIVYKATAKTSS